MADHSGSFEDYWVEFVRAHRSPESRRVRFVAMTAGFALSVVAAVSRKAGLFAAALAVAAVPGIGALRTVRADGTSLPARVSFAAMANLRMWQLTLLGTMDAEVRRVLGDESPASAAAEEGGEPLPKPNMVTDHTLH
jgi:hypothetical protein